MKSTLHASVYFPICDGPTRSSTQAANSKIIIDSRDYKGYTGELTSTTPKGYLYYKITKVWTAQ